MSRAKNSISSGGAATARSDDRARAGFRQVAIDLLGLDQVVGDSVGLFCWSDVRPLVGVAGYIDWRLCGSLSQALVNRNFMGDAGEVMLLPVSGRFGPRRLFVFGLGPVAAWDGEVLRTGARQAVEVMRKAGATSVVLGAPASRTDSSIENAFVKAAQDELAQQIGQVLTEKV